MIYLASPYTAKTKELQEEKYQSVLRLCGKLLKERHNVWSPIVHCHTMAVLFDLPTDFVFWKQYNHDFIRRSDAVWIACIDGWEQSKGVADEIEFANLLGIPVSHVIEHEGKVVIASV
jgi:nucleoside 2-deoxyribosyltransferase